MKNEELKEKVRYETDPHNRLVVKGRGVEKFRTVLDGEFKPGEDHSLIYHVKKSDGIDVPQQVKFSGAWSLDKKHRLIFTLDKWNNQVEGNKLVLKGDLIAADAGELVFSITTKPRSDLGPARRGPTSMRVYLLKFGGAWQADKYNRLSFVVSKEGGGRDVLTLQGKWEINKQNELTYIYPKSLITLRGYWDIAKKNRLSYVLNKDLDSGFNFKASFQRAETDALRYGVSFGYGDKKKTVTLFGKWRFDKNTGLSFEIKSAGKGVRAEAALSRSLLKGRGEAFIKTCVSEKEYVIMAGAGFRW